MMGSVTRRLQALEDCSREQAAAQIRQAWDRLSDEEMALILAPGHFGREPTPKEARAQKESREAMPQSLIAHAIGYQEEMPGEEVSRRLKEVTDPVLKTRRHGLLRQLQSFAEDG
jgi:hypothetical protein